MFFPFYNMWLLDLDDRKGYWLRTDCRFLSEEFFALLVCAGAISACDWFLRLAAFFFRQLKIVVSYLRRTEGLYKRIVTEVVSTQIERSHCDLLDRWYDVYYSPNTKSSLWIPALASKKPHLLRFAPIFNCQIVYYTYDAVHFMRKSRQVLMPIKFLNLFL